MMNTNITIMPKPIRTIHALNRSIRDLKEKQKDLEVRLDLNFQHLRHNYIRMSMNSAFGTVKKNSANFWREIITRFMESEKLQQGVGKFAASVADKIGEGIHAAGEKFNK